MYVYTICRRGGEVNKSDILEVMVQMAGVAMRAFQHRRCTHMGYLPLLRQAGIWLADFAHGGQYPHDDELDDF